MCAIIPLSPQPHLDECVNQCRPAIMQSCAEIIDALLLPFSALSAVVVRRRRFAMSSPAFNPHFAYSTVPHQLRMRPVTYVEKQMNIFPAVLLIWSFFPLQPRLPGGRESRISVLEYSADLCFAGVCGRRSINFMAWHGNRGLNFQKSDEKRTIIKHEGSVLYKWD